MVELVVVLTILVVLGGSAIFLTVGIIDDAKATTVDGDLKAIDTYLASYMRNNYGKPPEQNQGLIALVEKPSDNPPKKWRQYATEELIDPWGNPYQYRYPAQKSKKKYDIWSGGEDPATEEDDIGNW